MMRGDLSLANETQFLELIASGRAVPDVFLALCKFFEAAAVVWERRETDLKRSEAFLAQAQRLTKTGCVWWKPSSGEIKWSDGNYALMDYPVRITPTVEMAFDRCHPEDLTLVQETLARAIRDGSPVDFEHRLMMPGGAVKHVRFVVQNVAPAQGEPEFVGAATDITDWKQAEEKLRNNESHLAELRSDLAHVTRVSSLAMLTASIAREVSQPLSGIVVNASTCVRSNPGWSSSSIRSIPRSARAWASGCPSVVRSSTAMPVSSGRSRTMVLGSRLRLPFLGREDSTDDLDQGAPSPYRMPSQAQATEVTS